MAQEKVSAASRVTFSVSNRTVDWDESFDNLLEFAEAQGLNPPYSCRSGICNSCMRDIVGEVTYVEEPLREPGEGLALICCSIPKGDVAIDL
ncbi:MAG: 2Fe-2S iron-sulfur cluster-binding protein [Pseudolabrys sp.]|jgi:ferredoxin